MPKKKVTKKRPKKKENNLDIRLKVDNVEKLIKEGKKCENKKYGSCGGCWIFGSALAMILSYVQNSSIFWAILHGIISWFYVIYRIIVDYNLFG